MSAVQECGHTVVRDGLQYRCNRPAAVHGRDPNSWHLQNSPIGSSASWGPDGRGFADHVRRARADLYEAVDSLNAAAFRLDSYAERASRPRDVDVRAIERRLNEIRNELETLLRRGPENAGIPVDAAATEVVS